jgi:hypothetical protein
VRAHADVPERKLRPTRRSRHRGGRRTGSGRQCPEAGWSLPCSTR